MLNKLIALFLCLLLVVSFAACKKDKNDVDSSSKPTTSDPTQDYDKDEWYEGEDLTEEDKEEIEDLWNDLVQNGGGAEIQVPSDKDEDESKTSGTSSNSSQNSSSVASSDKGSSSDKSSSVASSSKPSSTTDSSTSKPSSSSSSSGTTEDKDNLNANIETDRPAIW